MRDELLSADRDPEVDDVEVEAGLRPRRLDEFVGQPELKGHLRVMLEAARRRGQAADHFLFAGPPGLPRKMLSAKSIMKRVAPVACKKAPKTTNKKTYVNMTFIAMPKTPWLCRNA